MKYLRSWKADGQMIIDLAVPRKPKNGSSQKLEKAKNQTIYAIEFWQHKLLTLGPFHSSSPTDFPNNNNKACTF